MCVCVDRETRWWNSYGARKWDARYEHERTIHDEKSKMAAGFFCSFVRSDIFLLSSGKIQIVCSTFYASMLSYTHRVYTVVCVCTPAYVCVFERACVCVSVVWYAMRNGWLRVRKNVCVCVCVHELVYVLLLWPIRHNFFSVWPDSLQIQICKIDTESHSYEWSNNFRKAIQIPKHS